MKPGDERYAVQTWRDKMVSQKADARYNEMLYYGLSDKEE